MINDEEVISKIMNNPKYDKERESQDKSLYETTCYQPPSHNTVVTASKRRGGEIYVTTN